MILSNDPDLVEDVLHDHPFGKCHHSVRKFTLSVKLKYENTPIKPKYQINQGKYEEIRAYVIDLDGKKYFSMEIILTLVGA